MSVMKKQGLAIVAVVCALATVACQAPAPPAAPAAPAAPDDRAANGPAFDTFIEVLNTKAYDKIGDAFAPNFGRRYPFGPRSGNRYAPDLRPVLTPRSRLAPNWSPTSSG